MSPVAFLIFNATGFIISIAAIAIIVSQANKIFKLGGFKLLSLVKGFVFIAFSFLWTLFFGYLAAPNQIITVQTVLLSLGMAFLIHAANKLFEIYEREKKI